ncbi:hypothetical protein [Agrococcus lahaulensis]|nr:hypothetical protein [Agrococcus lahaulensis]
MASTCRTERRRLYTALQGHEVDGLSERGFSRYGAKTLDPTAG